MMVSAGQTQGGVHGVARGGWSHDEAYQPEAEGSEPQKREEAQDGVHNVVPFRRARQRTDEQ